MHLVFVLALALLGLGAWLAIGIQSTLSALAGLEAERSAPSASFADAYERLLWQAAGATLALLALLGLFAWLLAERAARGVAAIRRELRATTITRDYLDQILSGMNEALVVVDHQGRIVRVNPAACQMAARTEAELISQPLSILLGEARAAELLGNGHDTRPREAKLLRIDGEHVPVSLTFSTVDAPEADLSGHVIVAQDVSERRRADQRIRYLARIDSLTKVPNRMQFQHLLQRGIARARRRGRYLALMYIDVDRFKDINDTYGHLAGDITLEQFSERLLRCLPDSATVGRLAGDEFAVVLDEFESLDEMMAALEQQATTVLEALTRPLDVLGHEIYLTASIGLARYPLDAGDVIDLIRNADAALYVAKKTGGNNFAVYSPEMNDKAVERLMLKSKLRRALENDELTLRYQPKYSLATGKVMGAEALVRWDMPERGMIPPGDFVPLAEETNLILELGNWVLHRVCEDYRRWQRTLASPGRVSVNLSLKQLRQRHFLRQVGDVFLTHGVSPTCLELEITETTLMEDTERTIKLLNGLYGMGLHLAIDDFGTGYSSLSALQQFPISTLKIDRSFVQHAATDSDDATIVSTIIQMGHNLGIEVVAEGVETQAQLEFLRAERCDYAQGMLFGEPFEADEYAALLLRQLEGTDVHRTLFA